MKKHFLNLKYLMNRKDISYVFRKWLLADKVRFKFSAYIYTKTLRQKSLSLQDFGWDLFMEGVSGVNFIRERK